MYDFNHFLKTIILFLVLLIFIEYCNYFESNKVIISSIWTSDQEVIGLTPVGPTYTVCTWIFQSSKQPVLLTEKSYFS